MLKAILPPMEAILKSIFHLPSSFHLGIERLMKGATLPPMPLSTKLFYYVISITDQRDKDVQDIPLPKPKAILEFTSLEYAIPGLRVPTNEEDDNLDLFIEGQEEQPTELSRVFNKVIGMNKGTDTTEQHILFSHLKSENTYQVLGHTLNVTLELEIN